MSYWHFPQFYTHDLLLCAIVFWITYWRNAITPAIYEIESSGFLQHLQEWFYYLIHYLFSSGQLWVRLCVRHILIFLVIFKVWCPVTDVQTETQPPKGLITNGIHSRIICEDVAKNRNFLSRKLRALLPFSHRSFEKKQHIKANQGC